MEPRYPEGTIIMVDCEQKPLHKDFSLIYLPEKDCLLFKQIIHLDGEIYAKALNLAYQPLLLPPSATLIGKVVQAKLIC
jgi:SOS-response transcriptional repressor LexA